MKINKKIEEDNEEDQIFDWLVKTYDEANTTIDLTQYEVTLGPIYKEPNGEETLSSLKVRKKSHE